MTRHIFRRSDAASHALASLVLFFVVALVSLSAVAQTVEDASDTVIGKQDTKTILALIKGHLERGDDAKVSALRRSTGSLVCGTVNVKGKQDLYLGERGFIADVAALTFDRVPEGVELLNPRAEGFEEKEKVRELYFAKCLD